MTDFPALARILEGLNLVRSDLMHALQRAGDDIDEMMRSLDVPTDDAVEKTSNSINGSSLDLTTADENKTKFSAEFPESLERVLQYISNTGDGRTPINLNWETELRPVLLARLAFNLRTNFVANETLPSYPNTAVFAMQEKNSDVVDRILSFCSCPFTIQRLCELLWRPTTHYKRIDRYLRAIERVVTISSTIEFPPIGDSTDLSVLLPAQRMAAQMAAGEPITTENSWHLNGTMADNDDDDDVDDENYSSTDVTTSALFTLRGPNNIFSTAAEQQVRDDQQYSATVTLPASTLVPSISGGQQHEFLPLTGQFPVEVSASKDDTTTATDYTVYRPVASTNANDTLSADAADIHSTSALFTSSSSPPQLHESSDDLLLHAAEPFEHAIDTGHSVNDKLSGQNSKSTGSLFHDDSQPPSSSHDTTFNDALDHNEAKDMPSLVAAAVVTPTYNVFSGGEMSGSESLGVGNAATEITRSVRDDQQQHSAGRASSPNTADLNQTSSIPSLHSDTTSDSIQPLLRDDAVLTNTSKRLQTIGDDDDSSKFSDNFTIPSDQSQEDLSEPDTSRALPYQVEQPLTPPVASKLPVDANQFDTFVHPPDADNLMADKTLSSLLTAQETVSASENDAKPTMTTAFASFLIQAPSQVAAARAAADQDERMDVDEDDGSGSNNNAAGSMGLVLPLPVTSLSNDDERMQEEVPIVNSSISNASTVAMDADAEQSGTLLANVDEPMQS